MRTFTQKIGVAAAVSLVLGIGFHIITTRSVDSSFATEPQPLSASVHGDPVTTDGSASLDESPDPWAEFDRCVATANTISPFAKENPCFGGMAVDEVLLLTSDPETNRALREVSDPNVRALYQGDVNGAVAVVELWGMCKQIDTDATREKACIEFAEALPHARTLLSMEVERGNGQAAFALASDVEWQLRRMQRNNSLWDTYYNQAVNLYKLSASSVPAAAKQLESLQQYFVSLSSARIMSSGSSSRAISTDVLDTEIGSLQ